MQPGISNTLRRTLLLKVISKPQPTREDVASVIELTASKVVEALEAQSMTLYLVEGGKIRFRHVYYSPTLWEDDPSKEKEFAEKRETLLNMDLPMGTGFVGKVIDTGKSVFLAPSRKDTSSMFSLMKDTGFRVTSMLTVPLICKERTVGAIQVLNKEPFALHKEFTEDDLKVLDETAEYSAPLIRRMLDPKFQIDDMDTARYIAKFTDNPLLTSESEISIDEKLIEIAGEQVIKREGVLPFKRLSPSSIAAIMTNPLDYPRRESFQATTEMFIEEVYVAPQSLVNTILKRFFKDSGLSVAGITAGEGISELADVVGAEFTAGGDMNITDEDLADEESGTIIQLANRIIEDAYVSGASDVHVEPQENDLLVRYRIDGICEEKLRLPKAVAGALVARLKVMSELDIAEKRLPQDGRIVFSKYTRKNVNIDLRVATGPMNFGEKVVLRILDKTRSAMPITSLGFSEENLEKYRSCIRQPYGMILHCGPTGSGKSMSLFSALHEVSNPDVNIMTAEDPIEYTVPGINQLQVHRQIGLTFASALRSYLRMDPDIILVGEVRDRETAEIAVEAALTGHLLLSTLHTNDAASTIARLTDMEIEPFMVSASLLVVCAQRLMRRVCPECCERYTPEGNEADIFRRAIGWVGEIPRASKDGCNACGGNAMKGRIGIHELMVNDEELTRAINGGAKTDTIKRIAMAQGMKTLHQDSMMKVREGVSTILEAISTVPPDLVTGEPHNEEQAP